VAGLLAAALNVSTIGVTLLAMRGIYRRALSRSENETQRLVITRTLK
jgi:hypothetical protein